MSLRRVPLAGSGPKTYFPNVVFRIVRGPETTLVPPPGAPAKRGATATKLLPNQAVFRVPQSVNKLDIKNYLSSLYGVQVLDVRTSNYLAAEGRDRQTGRPTRRAAYKRALVTLGSDFTFPPPPSPEKVDKVTAFLDFTKDRNRQKWEQKRVAGSTDAGTAAADKS